MNKRSTRVRVTRIAAAAVIAAGASLTVAGVAQAASMDGGVSVGAKVTLADTETTTPSGTDSTTPGGDQTTTPGSGETTTPGSGETTTPGSGETTTPGSGETTTPGSGETTTPGSGETTTPGETTPATTPPTTAPGTIAGLTGDDDSGSTGSPSSAPANDNTCTLTGDSVNCTNNNPGTDNTQQVPQGATTNQLAETGSSGMTYLIVGAATMIAGGVAFRLTPRIAGRRGDA